MRTNAGNDYVAAQLCGAGSVNTAHFMGVTATAAVPAVTDVALAGEITTVAGGLIRTASAYAHTAGTSVITLTNTFTANASDVLPVTLAKIGVFTAVTAGTLVYETALSATATLSAVGDSVTVTESISY